MFGPDQMGLVKDREKEVGLILLKEGGRKKTTTVEEIGFYTCCFFETLGR